MIGICERRDIYFHILFRSCDDTLIIYLPKLTLTLLLYLFIITYELYLPAARVYISFVFSNARRVLSQCTAQASLFVK